MTTRTFPTVQTLTLKDLYYNVELIFDKSAKGMTVIYEGIETTHDMVVLEGDNTLLIQQTSDRRDIDGDKVRKQHPFSKVPFFEMSKYKTPLQGGKVPPAAPQRPTFQDALKKTFTSEPSVPETTPKVHITIITGPTDVTLHNCISVVGTMQGNLEGDIHGSSYLNLDGVNEAKLDVRGQAKVRLNEVNRLQVTTDGTSHVRVTGITKKSHVETYGNSRVTLKGGTIDGLTVRSDENSSVYVLAAVTDANFAAYNQAVVDVDGSCKWGTVSAYDGGKVFLSDGPETNNIRTDELSAVLG